jgi:hypothetical protein
MYTWVVCVEGIVKPQSHARAQLGSGEVFGLMVN